MQSHFYPYRFFCLKQVITAMFLINAHPTRGRLLEYGHVIERGVYKIITGKRGGGGGVYWRWAFKRTWAFIGENTVM